MTGFEPPKSGPQKQLLLRVCLPQAEALPWLDVLVQRLTDVADVRCMYLPSHTEKLLSADVALAFTEADAKLALRHAAVVWLVVDAQGALLDVRRPLLEAITCGQGVALALLQYHPLRHTWRLVRELHRGSPLRYAQGVREVPVSIAHLVVLAARQMQLSGGRPLKTSRNVVLRKVPALSRPAWHYYVIGYWRAWKRRQAERWTSEYWRIGVIDMPVMEVLKTAKLPRVRWITPNDPRGYWADPFPLPGRSDAIVCEYFDEHQGLGRLEVLKLDAANNMLERHALLTGEGRHVSFPHAFEHVGRRFAVIETVALRECALYELLGNGVWNKRCVLIDNVGAADPAVFQWEGRWWLAFTDTDFGVGDNLCLYYADQLEGPWQPHRNNPVKIDVCGARMAGAFFVDNGQLFRPGQDCLRGYGMAVEVYRVRRLTPDDYAEEPVKRIQPSPLGACPDGLHTLNGWGDKTLLDGKRHDFNVWTMVRKIKQRGRRDGSMPVATDAAATSRQGLLFVYIPHLRMGGGETSMLRIAHGLHMAGLDVRVLVHTLETCEISLPDGLPVIDLHCAGTFGALRKLVAVLRLHQPDWLLSAFPHTNVAAVSAVALARVATRCIVTEHAPLSLQITQQGVWRYRLLPPLVRWAYRRADAVVAVSRGVAQDLQRLIGAGLQPSVLSNPVLLPGFEQEMREPVEHPWLQDKRFELVLSLGRLSVEKGVSTVIDAFARVHQQRSQARLLVVGDGPDRQRLMEQVTRLGLQEVVQFPGRTTTPLRWMRGVDVFVLASQYEGFGNVLVEALASGAAVVSTDCPVGPREILEDGRWGALVPVGDAAAMAGAISQALQRAGSIPGAQESASRYTQENACKAYRALLEELAPGRGAHAH